MSSSNDHVTFHRIDPVAYGKDRKGVDYLIKGGHVSCKDRGVSVFSTSQKTHKKSRVNAKSNNVCHCLDRSRLDELNLTLQNTRMETEYFVTAYGLEHHWHIAPKEGVKMTEDEFLAAVADPRLWSKCEMVDGVAASILEMTNTKYIPDYLRRELAYDLESLSPFASGHDALYCQTVVGRLWTQEIDDLSVYDKAVSLHVSKLYVKDLETGNDGMEDLPIDVYCFNEYFCVLEEACAEHVSE